jgi:DNA modification methylase
MIKILQGDCLAKLAELPDKSVQCCVTSPPYWGLRDYGVKGQIGLEKTPAEYVAKMVAVFAEVRRVLRDDGTLWLNLGDCYATGGGRVGDAPGGGKQGEAWKLRGVMTTPNRMPIPGLKPKDLVGIPWRVGFALQADGWYLRSDIIWNKPNPMPESVTDRPTKSHEYIFLMSKSAKYFYDAEAIKEPVNGTAHRRKANGKNSRMVLERAAGRENSKPNPSRSNIPGVTPKSAPSGSGIKSNESFNAAVTDLVDDRNKRTVWTVATAPYKEAHFATFPPDLIKPCIMAGTKPGDTVLDPFGGSGTTGQVAIELGRKAILIELNPDYCALIKNRTNVTAGLPL